MTALAHGTLAVAFFAVLLIAPSFAHASLDYDSISSVAPRHDQPIELAQAQLPSVGGIDDYMHQSGDGPATAPSSPNYYSPQPSAPPPGYGYQGSRPPEWSNSYNSDPNAQRNLLIGAAVVGAVMVGMWAYQQHELHEAQVRSNRRYYGRRPYLR